MESRAGWEDWVLAVSSDIVQDQRISSQLRGLSIKWPEELYFNDLLLKVIRRRALALFPVIRSPLKCIEAAEAWLIWELRGCQPLRSVR